MSEILFPVGRMIGGSVYTAQVEKDSFGKPKLNSEGKQLTSFSFGVAIPKQGEQHWSQTPWGQQVFQVGATAHANHHRLPTYAWKIKDGDSTVPNRNGTIMNQQPGHAGCWIVWFKQTWAPKLVADKGATPLLEPDQIIPGYYVEVYANVIGNTGPTPGVYMNPIAVNRAAFGEKIVSTQTIDTTGVGFGASPLPTGASATPLGGFVPPPVAAVMPGLPIAPTGPAVVPNPAFLMPPAPPLAPPVPAAPPVRQMTAKAGGATYEQMIGAGWTDNLLREHGMML